MRKTKKQNLFDEESEDEEQIELKTNESYAKSYNEFRKKELLSHLKNGDLEDESSSSDDLSTDEEVENPEFDKEFFKTLAYLKSKNPEKYSEKPKFFEKTKTVEEFLKEKQKKKEKEKPVTIKDYKRELLLKHGPDFVEEDADPEEKARAASPSYVEEQEKLRQELKKALDDSSDDEDVLQKRDKTREEEEKEQNDYLAWLAGQKESVPEEEVKELKPLKEYWTSNNLTKDDQFLKDYILNKRYLENAAIPTYDEIVGTLEEDEEEFEKQEEFEHKYNYRFEDPDKEFLKRYPRTIPDSVRAVDNKRKEKRKERQERKEQEKLQRKKDLDELNKLRKQELEEKLERLKQVAQNEKFSLNEDELASDFDPEEHDRRMQAAFDDNYYMINEGEQKPEFPDLDQELGIEDWDNYDVEKEDEEDPENDPEAPHCEDDDFIMDCDYDPEAAKAEKSKMLQEELIESTRSKRKKKKRTSKLAEIIKTKKPVYEPNSDKTYEEYLDEYYKLDYEDIIGDQPCRFKYSETVPNDFGLTIEEILMASNKELNQWASLKKTMQNLPKHVEMNEYYKYKKRAQNEALKRKIFKSIYGAAEDEQLDENIQKEVKEPSPEPGEKPVESKKRKKRKKQASNVDPKVSNEAPKQPETAPEHEKPSEESKVPSENPKKRKLEPETDQKTPETKKNKKKKQKTESTSPVAPKNNPPKVVKDEKKTKKSPGKATKKFSKDQKQKKPQFKLVKSSEPLSDLSENRLRAFGINPKRFYNKLKYGPNSQNNKNNAKKAENGKKPKNFNKNNKNKAAKASN
ncbi:protein KRI1 homolog [Culicoides brevitarsis]|uniref:protein KRI1 homolog n=1 Tax=Culicoides brevitarsis TaxID=469753 RepID=UPI00307C7A75